MAKSIIELTRGIPTTAKGWLDIFSRINRFLQVSGDELIIGGDIQLPAQSVGTAELEDAAVTDVKLRQSQATSVIGRSVASAGSPTDIQAGSDGQYLRRAGGVLLFGAIADSDVPATIARDTEVAAAISAHEAAADPHPTYTTNAEATALAGAAVTAHEAALDPHSQYPRYADDETITGRWTFADAFQLPSFTVATLPSAATYERGVIYVSDESGGAVPAFSDGTNWRRFTDRTIVS